VPRVNAAVYGGLVGRLECAMLPVHGKFEKEKSSHRIKPPPPVALALVILISTIVVSTMVISIFMVQLTLIGMPKHVWLILATPETGVAFEELM
jgi:hypothetical protein